MKIVFNLVVALSMGLIAALIDHAPSYFSGFVVLFILLTLTIIDKIDDLQKEIKKLNDSGKSQDKSGDNWQ